MYYFQTHYVLLAINIPVQHMTGFVVQDHNYHTKSVDGQSNSTQILTVYHSVFLCLWRSRPEYVSGIELRELFKWLSEQKLSQWLICAEKYRPLVFCQRGQG